MRVQDTTASATSSGGINLSAGKVAPSHDADHVAHMLQLFDGLLGQKARRRKVRRIVEPLADLDAGHLAVEELVHDPGEDLAVGRGIEPVTPEVERHLLAREQHRLKSPAASGRAQARLSGHGAGTGGAAAAAARTIAGRGHAATAARTADVAAGAARVTIGRPLTIALDVAGLAAAADHVADGSPFTHGRAAALGAVDGASAGARATDGGTGVELDVAVAAAGAGDFAVDTGLEITLAGAGAVEGAVGLAAALAQGLGVAAGGAAGAAGQVAGVLRLAAEADVVRRRRCPAALGSAHQHAALSIPRTAALGGGAKGACSSSLAGTTAARAAAVALTGHLRTTVVATTGHGERDH